MKQLAIAVVALGAAALGWAQPAAATSGPGCLRVVNVESWDWLNMRARPSASARIVDRLHPTRHGIISLRGDCVPKSRPWGSRWCPVRHFDGDRTSRGWVKARFVRDSDCP